jgi:hypothetical protein
MAPSKRYADFPESIFTLKCSQHRAHRMRFLLCHFSKSCARKATKLVLLQELVKLEREVTSAEDTAIREWLHSDSGTPSKLAVRLKKARRIKNPPQPWIFQNRFPFLPPPPSPQVLECCVCMESMGLETFPQQKITQLCNHTPMVCRNCLIQSIDSQIPDVAWDQIKCPECPETLPYDVVQNWASREAFEKWIPSYFL